MHIPVLANLSTVGNSTEVDDILVQGSRHNKCPPHLLFTVDNRIHVSSALIWQVKYVWVQTDCFLTQLDVEVVAFLSCNVKPEEINPPGSQPGSEQSQQVCLCYVCFQKTAQEYWDGFMWKSHLKSLTGPAWSSILASVLGHCASLLYCSRKKTTINHNP